MPHSLITNIGDGNVVKMECHESLPSAYELARMYAKHGYPDKYVVFSERQTRFSASGEIIKPGTSERGVYLSLILRPSIFPSQASFLGPISAVALITALEEHTAKSLGLGWISDVYCEGRKIGGTTTEGMLDNFSTYEYIIINFSVRLSDSDFPPRLNDLIKKVFESENTSISMIIAKNILSKFFALYPRSLKSAEKVMEIFKKKFILAGTKITYSENGRKKRAKIIAVDSDDASLIVSARGGKIKRIISRRDLDIPRKIKLK